MRKGFVLVTALTMLVVLMALITAYFTLTRFEISSTKSVSDSTTGFYAAEAGLNLRVEEVKSLFQNYGRPSTSGSPTNGLNDCLAASSTSNVSDFSCQQTEVQHRKVYTFLSPDSGGTYRATLPAGGAFGGLSYVGYNYDLTSAAYLQNRPEAILKMRFTVQYIPMFQFAAFYDGDFELHPGPPMRLSGPIHTNANLYISAANGNPSSNSLDITGQVSAAGNLVRGRKNGDSEQFTTACPGLVRIRQNGSSSTDPATFPALLPSGGSSSSCPYQLATNFGDFAGSVRAANGPEAYRVNRVQIPKPDFLDPRSGYTYWDHAELRLELNLDPSNPNPGIGNISVRNAAGDIISGQTTALTQTCTGALGGHPVGTSNTFYNMREGLNDQAKLMRFLEVDMQGLLSCIQNNAGAFDFNLSDATDGGLVFYLYVKAPDIAVGCQQTLNNCQPTRYGVRIRNGADLGSINGLTVVTNGAMYIQGDYNSTNKKPAAILSDSLNVLSKGWTDDGTATDTCKGQTYYRSTCNDGPAAESTTINAAFLTGVDVTANGAGNGGLQNYPRFHENWDGKTFNYRGSFVSLDQPRYVNGPFAQSGSRPGQRYNPPIRAWDYDTDFNNPDKLPPLTPYVVNVQQQLFSRDFEQK